VGRREQLIAEFWRRGDLQYKLWNNVQRKIKLKLQDCLDRKTGMLFVNAARGTGKTTLACNTSLEVIRSLTIKKPQVFFATAFAEDLRSIITPTFERLMEDKPPQIKITHVPSKKMYLDHGTGGLMHYRGLDLKRNSLRGNYADFVVLEECQNIKSLGYQWNYVIKQLFRHRPNPLCMFIGTPPETPDHDWVELMELARLSDSYIELTIDEHDMLSEEEKAFLMKDIRPDAIQREFYCKLVVDSTRAIVPEWRDEFVQEIEHDRFRPFYHNYNALDMGVKRDYTAGLIGYYDFLRAAIVIEHEYEIMGPEMTTKLLAKLIKDKEKEAVPDWRFHKRVADNNWPLMVQDLNIDYDLPFISTDKAALRTMVNKVRIWADAGRILIHPRCKKLLGCLRTGIWNEQRNEFGTSFVYGHYDWLAALVYLVRNIDEGINPIPPYFGINLASPNTVIIPGHKKGIVKRFGE